MLTECTPLTMTSAGACDRTLKRANCVITRQCVKNNSCVVLPAQQLAHYLNIDKIKPSLPECTKRTHKPATLRWSVCPKQKSARPSQGV